MTMGKHYTGHPLELATFSGAGPVHPALNVSADSRANTFYIDVK